MISWPLITEAATRYGWLIPATLAVISLVYLASAKKDYREKPTPANKKELVAARKRCVFWLGITLLLGLLSIWALTQPVAT